MNIKHKVQFKLISGIKLRLKSCYTTCSLKILQFDAMYSNVAYFCYYYAIMCECVFFYSLQ